MGMARLVKKQQAPCFADQTIGVFDQTAESVVD